MKIALACQSILLEKALKIFLAPYLSTYKHCDFVISDKKIEIEKPLFFVSSENSHLDMPFSKSSLLLELENFFDSLEPKQNESLHVKKNFHELEEKILLLTEEFRENLVQTIKDYYEK